jgi:hypothetical protein
MEDTTMRTMMIAALFTAACGSVTPPAGNNKGSDDMGSDMGSDTGSGSGSGSSGPATCMSAADCATGQACDLTQHMCVAAAFTLDKAGFIDDGTRWWTNMGNPTLHGTLDNPGSDPLTAYINNNAVGTATITGTTWSIALPMNAIAETDTRVVLKMGNIEQSQMFALDDKAPTAMLFGSIKDERGDQIDFSTGEAVHTHAGAAVDLTTGCPAVYKYAYLEDQTAPMYGREVAPNPLAWQIKVSDSTPLDSMDSAYRVRDASGTVLYDWTSISPDATGVYTVSLFRNKIPQLGTEASQMHLDVRFRDSFGNESTTSACWDNHPMAAPVEIGALATNDTFFGYTLAADSPISYLLKSGLVVYTQDIYQHAAEPVSFKIANTMPAVHYTMTGVDNMVGDVPVSMSVACTDLNDAKCDTSAPADPADKIDSGTLNANWAKAVVDATTGHTVCYDPGVGTPCTLPARTASEAPHHYWLYFELHDQTQLAPPGLVFDDSAYGEWTFKGVTYTGLAPANPVTKCSRTFQKVINGNTFYSCVQQITYSEIRALDKATLAFPTLTETFETSPTSDGTLEAVTYAGTALTIAAKTWNAGTDVLP